MSERCASESSESMCQNEVSVTLRQLAPGLVTRPSLAHVMAILPLSRPRLGSPRAKADDITETRPLAPLHRALALVVLRWPPQSTAFMVSFPATA